MYLHNKEVLVRDADLQFEQDNLTVCLNPPDSIQAQIELGEELFTVVFEVREDVSKERSKRKCHLCHNAKICGRAKIALEEIYAGYIDHKVDSDVGEKAQKKLTRQISKNICGGCGFRFLENLSRLHGKLIK